MVQWTDVTLKNHHQIINDAPAFLETFKLDDESSAASMKSAASTKIEKTLSSKSMKAASMTSSQRKKAQLAAKLRHEELGRKSEAAARLAKEKQKLESQQSRRKTGLRLLSPGLE